MEGFVWEMLRFILSFSRVNTFMGMLLLCAMCNIPTTPFERPGIYSLSCFTCNKEYVGQTGRRFELRYKEHIRYIKYNIPQSAYALHILNNRHEYSPIHENMTLLKPLKITSLLSPYEHCFIQSLHKAGKLISEQHPGPVHPLLQLAFNRSHPLS